VVGLDLGVRDFVTLSGAEQIERPQYDRKAQRKRRRLAGLEERMANQRRNFHHQLRYKGA
jgi:transposase